MIKVFRKIYYSIFGAVHLELQQAIDPFINVLDVGCGDNSLISFFSNTIKAVGIDGFSQAIESSKTKRIHKEYLEMDLNDIGTKISHNSYDCVLCLDVIEHFDKESSHKFIKELEKIASHKVVLQTPNGFLPQGAIGGNPFQIHRCGWTVEELEAIGYSVIGIYGLKMLRGERADYLIKPRFLGRIISDLTQPFVRNNPQKAFSLLATKTCKS